MGENVDEFDEFSAIYQYFIHQNFPFYYTDDLFYWLPLKVTEYETP